MTTIHNCHAHVFTNANVPNGFLPFGLLLVLRWRIVAGALNWLLRRLIPFDKNDLFDRVASIVGIGQHNTPLEILQILRGYYPEGSKFVLLSMDMEHMCAGRVVQPYRRQLEDLRELKRRFPEEVFPFVCADPRRMEVTDIVKEYIEKHGYTGIKLYPPLGFFPFDPKLDEVYRYAEACQAPVMTHCSRGGAYGRCPITPDMRVHPITGERLKGFWKKHFTDNYADPENYRHVLARFPNLKICLGHFGGIEEWRKYLTHAWRPHIDPKQSWNATIMDLIRDTRYPNVYADISYTSHDPALHPFIRVLVEDEALRQRILFGSDFYMVQVETSERAFSIGLRGFLGEENFRQIAEVNARRYLGI